MEPITACGLSLNGKGQGHLRAEIGCSACAEQYGTYIIDGSTATSVTVEYGVYVLWE